MRNLAFKKIQCVLYGTVSKILQHASVLYVFLRREYYGPVLQYLATGEILLSSKAYLEEHGLGNDSLHGWGPGGICQEGVSPEQTLDRELQGVKTQILFFFFFFFFFVFF